METEDVGANPKTQEESKSKQQKENPSAVEKTSLEICRAKMIFCALMETALSVRAEFFDVDLYQYANKMAAEIANKGRTSSDKKFVARNTFNLMKQVENARGERIALEGRLNVIIEKTLKGVPPEEKKAYPEIIEHMKELIKNREK